MTNRGRFLIIAGILGLWAAVLREQTALATLSLAVLVWCFACWVIFQVRLALRWPKYQVTRTIGGRPIEKVSTLWAGRKLDVELEINSSAGSAATIVIARDCMPDNLLLDQGLAMASTIDGAGVLRMQYDCHCPAAGKVNFFGVRFQFRDAFGLCLAERVFRDPREFRVLPAFGQASDLRPSIKRVNAIPQHGIHQLRRAGLGSELLELREYQPGDPPKSIAWKVTARRGKWMTRQYESEVPVRVSLFMDSGGNLREGALGARPLDHLSSVAASITKAAVSIGDAVGIVLLEDSVKKRMRPANGDRAFYGVLEALAEFAHVDLVAPSALPPLLLDFAAALANERYPDWLEPKVFSQPWSWLPIRPSKRRQKRQRRRLASVLSEIHQFSPTQFLELAHDEQILAKNTYAWLQKSGREHQVAERSSSEPRLSGADQPGRFDLLAKELTRAVAMASDNELFVVIADLLGAEHELDLLLSATKVALSRHHRVTFICPAPDFQKSIATMPKDVAEVLAKVESIDASERAKSLRRKIRRVGAKFAFAHDKSVVAAVMAEAELAGSGRFLARSPS